MLCATVAMNENSQHEARQINECRKMEGKRHGAVVHGFDNQSYVNNRQYNDDPISKVLTNFGNIFLRSH